METISFPHLGLSFSLSRVAFSIGSIDVYWYGLLIAIGFVLAVTYGMINAKRFKINTDKMIDVVLVAPLLAIVCARLYYVLFSDSLADYLAAPLSILALRDGGLAIYGAVIGAFITGLWMCKIKKISRLRMFDLASIGFLIGQCIGRWGNFFNQEAFGGNTTLPWGMTGSRIGIGLGGSDYNPALPVHPTFLYESLWCFVGFLILHIVSKKAYRFKGQLFGMYLVWYGVGRVWIEGLRTDSLMLGSLRVSQVLALLAIAAGVALLWWLSYRQKKFRRIDLPSENLFTDLSGEQQDLTEEMPEKTEEETDRGEAD